jgi:hypothetical protein
LNIDSQLESAIAKVRKDNAVLCFMQGTGYNLQKKEKERLSRIIGMNVVPAGAASNGATQVLPGPQSLLPLQAAPAISLPTEWIAFGPFPDKAPAVPVKELLAIPEKIELNGSVYPAQRIMRDGSLLDFEKLFGTKGRHQSAYAFCQIHSDDEQELRISAGADWWMTWFLNGEPVFDTADHGNTFSMVNSDNYPIVLKLKKGMNTLAVKVVSSGASFVVAVEESAVSQNGLSHPRLEGLVLDPQVGLVVNDPQARVLACYPDTTLCGIAERRDANSRSLFFGSYCLRRGTIRALAESAGAWCLTPVNYAIAANKRAVMIHPLVDGSVKVSLREPAALVEVNGKIPSQAWGKEHWLDLKVYETYLFRLEDQDTLAGVGVGTQTLKKGVLISYDFSVDAKAPDIVKKIVPAATDPRLTATTLRFGSGVHRDVGISGLGTPGPSLFINGKALNVKSEQEALSGDHGLSITITPRPESKIAISGFGFDLNRSDDRAVTSFALYADNGAGFEQVATGPLSKQFGNKNEDYITYRAELDKVEFLRSVTRPLVFKLYFYGSSYEDKAPGNVRLDNVVVYGAVSGK